MAEKITKDLNPSYGSIQKLHTRDSNLLALCEDKCLKILVEKDALFNADGSPQLLAKTGMLGQAVPFVGEFGISKNPESFSSESYRAYFTDKQRGAVVILSADGITPISDHGMRDWFRDNLKEHGTLLGTYDAHKQNYNISLKGFFETENFLRNAEFSELGEPFQQLVNLPMLLSGTFDSGGIPFAAGVPGPNLLQNSNLDNLSPFATFDYIDDITANPELLIEENLPNSSACLADSAWVYPYYFPQGAGMAWGGGAYPGHGGTNYSSAYKYLGGNLAYLRIYRFGAANGGTTPYVNIAFGSIDSTHHSRTTTTYPNGTQNTDMFPIYPGEKVRYNYKWWVNDPYGSYTNYINAKAYAWYDDGSGNAWHHVGTSSSSGKNTTTPKYPTKEITNSTSYNWTNFKVQWNNTTGATQLKYAWSGGIDEIGFKREWKRVFNFIDVADFWYSSNLAVSSVATEYWDTSTNQSVILAGAGTADTLNQDITLSVGTVYELTIDYAVVPSGVLKIVGVDTGGTDVDIIIDTNNDTGYATWTQDSSMTTFSIFADDNKRY